VIAVSIDCQTKKHKTILHIFFLLHPIKCNVINYEEMIYKMDDMQIGKFQELVNSLQLLEHICTKNSNLNAKQIEMYMSKLDDFLALINNPLCALRNLAARAISSISKLDIRKCMNLILDKVIFLLDREDSVYLRQGACELIYQFLDKFNYDIIPYIVPLIVPVLKRMTDYDCYIRSTASLCFSTLIKLYPLRTDDTDSSNKCFEIYIENENLKHLYMEQQDFLEQLCDNRKLKEYSLDPKLFVNKTISLRSYQQDGINWLAFLKRFNLHGILCDDMGLGKTLQSICVLAGDYFEKFTRGKVHEFERASIIVCPTTLTNHWYYEIKRFIHMDYLKPFIYGGNVNEREHLKREFSGNKNIYNIFIVSYETVRHDINFISTIQWNYAILDEGHLIKSTKTKLSKAIKQINASHRLILTGTPIQNNVFELWCLFDFLIPGYLGESPK
jgi:TATA-binding protein-associated factor